MIINRIYEWARSDPTKTAVVFDGHTLSYASFFNTIEASRKFFAQQGLPVGRTAIVLSKNVLEAWIFITALRAIGLNTIAIDSIAHLGQLKIKDAACVVVIQSEQDDHNLNCAALAGTKIIIVPNAILADSQTGYLSFYQQPDRPFGGHIICSSGTTGTHKKIMLPGALEDQRNDARVRTNSFDRRTVHHNLNFAMWSGSGFKNPSAVWHVGGCVVLDRGVNMFKHFFQHPITSSKLTPSLLRELIQSSGKAQLASNECVLLISAGFLPLELAEAAVRHLTKKVCVSYGSSELGASSMHSYFKSKDDLHWLTPIGDRTIQIVDEDGNECVTGQEGELRILPTDIDCKSYLDDEEASAKAFRHGFFYPGDIAIRRADGRIRILGRTADVLNVQGQKIPVTPLESAIQRELRVDEVCLFSRLNDDGKEELMVAIQSHQPLPQSRLQAIVGKLPPFQRVRFAVLKEFPRTETGIIKTRRAVLRKLVFSEESPATSVQADTR